MRLEPVNVFAVRFEVLRDGAVFRELIPADSNAEVQFVESSELAMSFRGSFYTPPADIDFLTDRLRPVVVLNGVEYPCGVFCITSEMERRSGGADAVDLEGYSPLYLAKRTKIEERVHFAAGENYITQILTLLGRCGIGLIESVASEYTFSADREDWEIGTPVLDIVNELLAEINYRPAWADLSGAVRITPYEVPSLENIAHVYSAGEFSMIEPDYSRSVDRYGKANVFRVECDSPDLDEPMAAIAENNVENSPFSIARLGRILHVEKIDGTPSQDALQAYADRLRDESLQTVEIAEFSTAPVPVHNAYDVIGLDNGGLAGLYTEVEWRLPLSPGASMYHRARRVYA